MKRSKPKKKVMLPKEAVEFLDGPPGAVFVLDLSIEGFSIGVKALAEAAKSGISVILFTSRWDNDKRELWEIPEARDLFIRTVDEAKKIAGDYKVLSVLSDESLLTVEACRNPDRVIIQRKEK